MSWPPQSALGMGRAVHVERIDEPVAGLVCRQCGLSDGYPYLTLTDTAMVAHLDDHRAAGYEVPA